MSLLVPDVIDWLCLYWFQVEGAKTPPELEDDAKPTSEGGLGLAGGRTRSVRSLGTADLIRTQKLKYFEGTCELPRGAVAM